MKVIKFTQENCTPCRNLNMMLENIEAQVDETIVITDENSEEIMGKYNIMSTPTMIMFNENGVEVARTSASREVGQIMAFFEKLEG